MIRLLTCSSYNWITTMGKYVKKSLPSKECGSTFLHELFFRKEDDKMADNNLHNINKLQNDIKASKWLSVFLPKEKRQQIKKLEANLANILHFIECFNKYFSNAGWCAHHGF